MRRWKAVLAFLLCWCLLAAPITPAMADIDWVMGDVDGNGNIDAADALKILQHAVKLIQLKDHPLLAGDTSGDSAVDAVDALLILQYTVRLISVFPNKNSPDQNPNLWTEEEYYANRDEAYGTDGSDFIDNGTVDLSDAGSVAEKYGAVPEKSDVETAPLDSAGRLIYNPISKSAKQLGALNRYSQAAKTTGRLELDGTVLEYSIPKKVTAYDAVPIQYKLVSNFPVMPVHISATTFEETNRYQDPAGNYFDCNLPGNIDFEFTYLGHVTGDTESGLAPSWQYDFTDTKGTQYPGYKTGSEILSGTVESGHTYTWFHFGYKNTGNTILDSWGNGAFCFEPILQRKNAQGAYENVSPHSFSVDNLKNRLYDFLYPGEEGDLWFLFVTEDSQGRHYLDPGEYRIIIETEVRNEQATSEWAANYVGGRRVGSATFNFQVAESGAVTQPNDVMFVGGSVNRNSWIGSFEEFQSSYQTLSDVSYDENAPTQGVIYVQPAPWDKTVSLKLMHQNLPKLATVHIPLEVESDSISITLNPYNDNYRVKEDGTREPLLMTQSMIDMRGNTQMGPDALSTGVNDLLNMKDAGINFITSTMSFAYTNNANDSFKFMMDAARVLGFEVEGFSHYPYNSQSALDNAKAVLGSKTIPNATVSGFGYSGMNQANGILANYMFNRYGDLFWVNGKGTLPIAAEDTRGWLTIDHDWRFGIVRRDMIDAYRGWLEGIYGDIATLNATYGSNFDSFGQIDPRKGATYEETHMGAYTHLGTDAVFQNGTKMMGDLDVYRTLARVQDYKEMMEAAQIKQEDVRFLIRTEGSTWLAAGLDPNSKNPRYRQAYWEQRRNAVIPEILSASGVVFGASNYDTYPWSPTETYELTKNSTRAGLTMSKMLMTAHLRDTVINTAYGSSKYVEDYHLADSSLKGACIDTSIAVFPYLKAMYEGGGIPGVMWQDYHCDGFITSTQYKELQFYTQKIQEMLSTEAGQAWATEFEAPSREFEADSKKIWSYEQDYIRSVLADTPRKNHFLNR